MDQKNRKTLIIVIIFVLIIIGLIFVFSKSCSSPANKTTDNGIKTSVAENKLANGNNAIPEEIIKCQKVIVQAPVTTEMFYYTAGNKFRADYRVQTNDEKTTYTTEIFYDGATLYSWKPPLYFGGEKPINPTGIKGRADDFKINVDSSVLDKIEQFSGVNIFGDFTCYKSEDAYQLEAAKDFEFVDTVDADRKVRDDIKRICEICTNSAEEKTRTECAKNLGCE